MGPLQQVSHMVQKPLAGEQETLWDKTNKENCHFTANAYYMVFRLVVVKREYCARVERVEGISGE